MPTINETINNELPWEPHRWHTHTPLTHSSKLPGWLFRCLWNQQGVGPLTKALKEEWHVLLSRMITTTSFFTASLFNQPVQVLCLCNWSWHQHHLIKLTFSSTKSILPWLPLKSPNSSHISLFSACPLSPVFWNKQ